MGTAVLQGTGESQERGKVCRTLGIVSSLRIDAGCLDESGCAVRTVETGLWVPTLGLTAPDDISYNTFCAVAMKRQYEAPPPHPAT